MQKNGSVKKLFVSFKKLFSEFCLFQETFGFFNNYRTLKIIMSPKSHGFKYTLLLCGICGMFLFQSSALGLSLTPPDVRVIGDSHGYTLSWNPVPETTAYGIFYNVHQFTSPGAGIVWRIVQNTSIMLFNDTLGETEIYIEIYALKAVAASDAWLEIPNGTENLEYQHSLPTYNIYLSFNSPGRYERIVYRVEDQDPNTNTEQNTALPAWVGPALGYGCLCVVGLWGLSYILKKRRNRVPLAASSPATKVKKITHHVGNPKHHRKRPMAR
jgi:hypothetical protein